VFAPSITLIILPGSKLQLTFSQDRLTLSEILHYHLALPTPNVHVQETDLLPLVTVGRGLVATLEPKLRQSAAIQVLKAVGLYGQDMKLSGLLTVVRWRETGRRRMIC